MKAVEVKELLYQAVAYLGLSRVYAFFAPTNTIFTNQGMSLPLASQKIRKIKLASVIIILALALIMLSVNY